eukprot:gene24986-30184_t
MKLSAYFLVILGLSLVIAVVFVLFVPELQDKKPKLELSKYSGKNSTPPPVLVSSTQRRQPSCVIILQRSIVDFDRQCLRLQAIDDSWGKWVDKFDNLKLVAAVPPPYCSPTLQLKHITIFNLTIPSTQEQNPYTYLMHTFQYHLNTHAGYDFLLLANDHTFLYPPNLIRFLRTLPTAGLLYSGNKLQLNNIQGKTLYFASGGAGCLMSTQTVLVYLATVMPLLTPVTRSPSHPGDTGTMILEWWQLEQQRDLVWKKYLRALSGEVPPPAKVVLNLSPTSTFSIFFSRKNDETYVQLPPVNHSAITSPPSSPLSSSSLLAVRELCTPQNKWSKNNPGIMVALCLSRIFRIPFTNSTLHGKSEGEERFHVYPPLRLVTRQIDDWYVDAKGYGEGKGKTDKKRKREITPSLLPLLLEGGEIATFHYVESAEAKVLYDLLDRKRTILLSATGMPDARMAAFVTPSELLSMWPPPSALGGYSYVPKDIHEAELLLRFLDSITI